MENSEKPKTQYELDLYIEEDELDMECLEQPTLMLKYSRIASGLRQKADLAKESLDLVKATVEREVRDDPEEFGIPKITEAAVKAAILLDERYIDANHKLIDAEYESRVAAGAVDATAARTKMLETMSRLHGQNYFAGPSTPHDLKELRRQRDEKIEGNISDKLNRPRQRQN